MSVTAPTSTPGPVTTATTIAVRTLRTLGRSPQVIGISIVQSLVFILVFRYVIGGAIKTSGGVSYVNYLIPGFLVSGTVFTASGNAVAVAEDAATGVYDRFRSLPISGAAVLIGRAASDAAFIFVITLITLAVGFIVGLRPTGTLLGSIATLGLIAIFAFVIAIIFEWLGLIAGNAQAAQGLGVLGVPFSFISSAFVPPSSMPAVLRAVADYQPLTFVINSARGFMLGHDITRTYDHSLTYYIIGSLIWCAALLAIVIPLSLRAYRSR